MGPAWLGGTRLFPGVSRRVDNRRRRRCPDRRTAVGHERRKMKDEMTEKQADLITISEPRSPTSEAYRTLRTNLDFASLDQALKTLVVTSAGVGEGKSTTLANLAV